MKTCQKHYGRFLPQSFFLTIILVGAMYLSPNMIAAEDTSITRTKAAFLYYLSKFVTWPEERFSERNHAITLCILGEDPFGQNLDLIIQTRNRREAFTDRPSFPRRHLIIRRLMKDEERNTCHILFVSASEIKMFSPILKELKDSSVLTVSDLAEFIPSGGMVHLALDQEKVHFEINLDLAENVGIKISSKLLKLATLVTLEGLNQK